MLFISQKLTNLHSRKYRKARSNLIVNGIKKYTLILNNGKEKAKRTILLIMYKLRNLFERKYSLYATQKSPHSLHKISKGHVLGAGYQ